MKILFVSIFDSLSTHNSRISSICKHLSEKYFIITTNFNHQTKLSIKQADRDNIKMINTPKYHSNLSLKRIYNHLYFAHRLKHYLYQLPQKDIKVIYCAMPTSTAAYVCGKYCKKHGIKFVIDVIDLWPDSLIPIIGGFKGKLLNWILFPWKYITIQAYKMADVIIGESKGYANEAAFYNKKALVYPLYLGVDRHNVASAISQSNLILNKFEDEIWIGYGGSLGTSYDFETLIKGVAVLNGVYQYKLLFIGDGVCRAEIEKLINQYSVNAQITGFIEYNDLLKYLSYCDIAINIFRDHTKVVHSYKFNDYVATNCFILNSLKGETSDMIDKYQIGLNFDFKENTLDKVLLHTVKHWKTYKEWKKNNRQLVTEILDKDVIYSKIANILST